MLGAEGTSSRKRDHLEVAVSEASQHGRSAGWEDVHLVHRSLPSVALRDIDTTTSFLGHELAAPLVIASMTGGHEEALRINRRLGQAAERLGLAVGVGSQRAALENPSLEGTYAVLREHAPSALVIGNLGICQLVPQEQTPAFSAEHIQRAVDMVEADALAIHLNIAEEMIQTEGDRNTSGLTAALADVVAVCPVPVIAKETGAGMCRETGRQLADHGAAAIDVGGAGGTSFTRVEAIRSARSGDVRGMRLGSSFGDWGISTVISVLETRDLGVPIIATGGLRNGVHAAKAMALGASLVGLGRPALQAAMESLDTLLGELELFVEELKIATLLSGADRPDELRKQGPVLTGFASEWMRQRGGAP